MRPNLTPLRGTLPALIGLVAVALAQPGAAHPLPGSTLILSHDQDSLDLSITVPLHELALALPQMAALGDAPPDGPLPPAMQPHLTAYFADHLALTPAHQTPLAPQITAATITGADHEDIGHYDLLVVDLTAPIPANQTIFPLTLTYDAVMHEVRNHTATVFWQSPGQTPVAKGSLRFDPSLGTSVPLILFTP